MRLLRRLLPPIAGLLAITAVGTIGYVIVEDMGWLDALFMTVITMSTVGYGEVAPLHADGRIFTVILIMGTVGTALYLFTDMAHALVETSVQDLIRGKQMQTRIAKLEGHVIVCGYGRFGHIVVEELRNSGTPIVIIEANPAQQPELANLGEPYVMGLATADDVLEQAGIEHARAIVVGTGSDPDNVYITLSARERNPEIRIHARGETDVAIRRLELAGANQVVSAYKMGGRALAASILRPAVVDFLEIARPRIGPAVELEELVIAAGCSLEGRSIDQIERELRRVRIVALKRGDAPIELVPQPDTNLIADDHLVVIGDSESLASIATRSSG
jgi:voltage-gated potassium channel